MRLETPLALKCIAFLGIALFCLLSTLQPGLCAPPNPVQIVGIIEPYLDVTLSAPVPGILIARHYEEGDRVEKGAVLLELDNALEKLEVQRRQIVRDQKFQDFEATKKLFSSTKGISREELEKKEAEYRVAAAECDIALEQLCRREIIAPNTGIVTDIMLEPGEACQAYESLIRVVDTSRCYVVANVEAREAGKFKRGQEVLLEVDLGQARTNVISKLVFVSPVVDAASGLQKVKVLFDNNDGTMRPGLTAVLRPERTVKNGLTSIGSQ